MHIQTSFNLRLRLIQESGTGPLGLLLCLLITKYVFCLTAEADRIMDTEANLLELPHGLPTFGSIETARLKQADSERVNHSHDLFL